MWRITNFPQNQQFATHSSLACGAKQQVCAEGADYSLGVEDYSEAIRRHIQDEGALASQS